jgi:hypothetical protein
MKFLSFSLNDEPAVEVVSAALAAPSRLIAADYHSKDTQLRNNSDFGFHGFIWLNCRGHPSLNYKSKAAALLDAKNYGSSLLLAC